MGGSWSVWERSSPSRLNPAHRNDLNLHCTSHNRFRFDRDITRATEHRTHNHNTNEASPRPSLSGHHASSWVTPHHTLPCLPSGDCVVCYDTRTLQPAHHHHNTHDQQLLPLIMGLSPAGQNSINCKPCKES